MLDALILSSAKTPLTHSTSYKLVVRATSGLGWNQTSDELSADSVEPRRRIVKPRKKKGWQWSKGTAPGEYGGPPTYINPRKMWGGENIDPITTKTDYIWNKQWKDFVQVTPAKPTKVEAPKQEQEAGFLSLSRAMALDSLDVDLSQDLMQPSVSILEQQVEAARFGISTDEAIKADKPRWRMSPTLREQKKWERASKAATGGTGMLMRNINRNKEDPAVIAAETKKQYNQLKQRLQLLTLTVGGVGALSAYVSYSPEVAASYGAGLLGSLVYLRMLGKSVDSYGVKGVKGAARGALGQPRLLVPVVLVMMYNRWNAVLEPEYGLVHLQLIPMLVGFFTYKVATFVQLVQDALPTFGEKTQS